MDEWHIYLVRTRLDALYTGVATDVDRRFAEHCAERGQGAKYLRSKGPLQLVYRTRLGNRSLALRAEHGIKRLPKAQKERIVTLQPSAIRLLHLLGLA